MYVYIKGLLRSKNREKAVVEAGGMGYELNIGTITYNSLPEHAEEVMLYTYHYLREDTEELYGFSTQEEKKLFEILIGISSIGPGKAMVVLSQISPDHFVQAVRNEDIAVLSSIKGIGRKTAERMLVDLKDKIADMPVLRDEASSISRASMEDAMAGLVGLGFKDNVAREMIYAVKDELTEDDQPQDIIKKALKKNG